MFQEIKYDEFVKVFEALSTNGWLAAKEIEDKEKALQKIVDFYSQRFFGIERLCSVAIIPFGDASNARYEPSLNTIFLREDMVQYGRVKMENGLEKTYTYPAKYAFFYLMHELRHAMQEYCITNPEKCPSDMRIDLIKLNQSNKDPELNLYLKSESTRLGPQKTVCHERLFVMHLLQPAEKDAWEFAHKEVQDFEDIMREMFPNDVAFRTKETYSSFSRHAKRANTLFNTQSPIKEINDIFLAMSHHNVDAELNSQMCSTLLNSQCDEMCQKVKAAVDLAKTCVEQQRIDAEKEYESVSNLFEDRQF